MRESVRTGRVIVCKAGGGFICAQKWGLLRISILISDNDTKANFPCEEELLIK